MHMYSNMQPTWNVAPRNNVMDCRTLITAATQTMKPVSLLKSRGVQVSLALKKNVTFKEDTSNCEMAFQDRMPMLNET